jgi:hypothetical protein
VFTSTLLGHNKERTSSLSKLARTIVDGATIERKVRTIFE